MAKLCLRRISDTICFCAKNASNVFCRTHMKVALNHTAYLNCLFYSPQKYNNKRACVRIVRCFEWHCGVGKGKKTTVRETTMLLFYCCCPGYSFSFSSESKTLFTPSGITCKLLEFFIINSIVIRIVSHVILRWRTFCYSAKYNLQYAVCSM